MKHIHYYKRPGKWVYIAIGKWQPFKFLQHGGWVFLNWRWFWRFIYEVPKARGWRWD